MQIITDINESNSLLDKYFGGNFQIAFYDESLRRIAIRIYFSDFNDKVVYLVGVGCESIRGRFSYSNADLLIEEEIAGQTQERVCRIFDNHNGFELLTSGVYSLAYGYESEFGTSFDDFIRR